MNRIDLNNTRVAFAAMGNGELKRAYWLFRMVSSNVLVKAGHKLTLLALRLHLPIEWLFRHTVFGHFCGGESIEGCNNRIELLSASGIGTILDYAAEGMTTEADFEATVAEIRRTIEKASVSASIPFAVFKVTGLARFGLLEAVQSGITLSENEISEYKRVRERVGSLCKLASDKKVRIFIDAEETWIQDVIDAMVLENMKLYNKTDCIVFTTFQMYRTDRLSYFEELLKMAQEEGFKIGVKLVRGAYMEKERERAVALGYKSPIQPDKASSDSAFDEAVSVSLRNPESVSVCVATHNEESIHTMVGLMEQAVMQNNTQTVWTAQLLGMSDNISYNLAAAGYNVAKYVPYGKVKTVIPYLLRRATENTSVGGQTSRELRLIREEMRRRKGGER